MEIVAPFTGAWIEIRRAGLSYGQYMARSHPSRVRGLKCQLRYRILPILCVAPFTGAWIEMVLSYMNAMTSKQVAPFTGAWIEMSSPAAGAASALSSHPSRVRGLKSGKIGGRPLFGPCRTLHGCVD